MAGTTFHTPIVVDVDTYPFSAPGVTVDLTEEDCMEEVLEDRLTFDEDVFERDVEEVPESSFEFDSQLFAEEASMVSVTRSEDKIFPPHIRALIAKRRAQNAKELAYLEKKEKYMNSKVTGPLKRKCKDR